MRQKLVQSCRMSGKAQFNNITIRKFQLLYERRGKMREEQTIGVRSFIMHRLTGNLCNKIHCEVFFQGCGEAGSRKSVRDKIGKSKAESGQLES